jgi:branched-chain amino acid transport system substrate-binding protein
MVQGAELAQQEINAAGGLLGQPMELVIVDTKAYVEERPAEQVDELVLKDHVLWISGACSDSIGWACRERCAYREVPFLSWVPGDARATRR